MTMIKQEALHNALLKLHEYESSIELLSRRVEALVSSIEGQRNLHASMINNREEIAMLRGRLDVLYPVVESLLSGKLDKRLAPQEDNPTQTERMVRKFI